MSNTLTLEELDRDGAIREGAEALSGLSRGSFLRRSALAGGGLLGGGAALAMLTPGVAAAATKGDVKILNYALTLEYLETAFYQEAVAMGALKGRVLKLAKVIAGHEAAHVAALKGALGKAAVAKPTFDFKGTTSDQAKFMATAIVLEDTGVAAYKGQAGLIKADAILSAALAIHTVEARHASWIRDLSGKPPAPVAFDQPLTMNAVLSAVTGTGFIVASRKTTSTSSPQFTG
jgi:rubrerythrin